MWAIFPLHLWIFMKRDHTRRYRSGLLFPISCVPIILLRILSQSRWLSALFLRWCLGSGSAFFERINHLWSFGTFEPRFHASAKLSVHWLMKLTALLYNCIIETELYDSSDSMPLNPALSCHVPPPQSTLSYSALRWQRNRQTGHVNTRWWSLDHRKLLMYSDFRPRVESWKRCSDNILNLNGEFAFLFLPHASVFECLLHDRAWAFPAIVCVSASQSVGRSGICSCRLLYRSYSYSTPCFFSSACYCHEATLMAHTCCRLNLKWIENLRGMLQRWTQEIILIKQSTEATQWVRLRTSALRFIWKRSDSSGNPTPDGDSVSQFYRSEI